jgi:metal-sulfur cluster biosynthetic enzyme
MKPKKILAIKRRLTRLIGSWKDPHTEQNLSETSQIQGLEVTENGKVNIAVVPERPHCPCCLFDLRDLRLKIAQIKGVTSVELIVTGVPAAERWTRVLNPQ